MLSNLILEGAVVFGDVLASPKTIEAMVKTFEESSRNKAPASIMFTDAFFREACSIHDVCSLVSLRKRENTSLTAAIRVFIMLYYKASSTEEGHVKVGHGNFEEMKRRARIDGEQSKYFSAQFYARRVDYSPIAARA